MEAREATVSLPSCSFGTLVRQSTDGFPMKSSPLRALAHYRLLPQTIALPTLAVAAIARIPYAMIPLGTMATVTAGTQSVTAGGTATGIVSLCAALASPIHGRISDVLSPRKLLILLWPLSSLATGCLLLSAINTWQDWRLWLSAAATGLTMIPVGAFTRARWVTSTTQPKTLATAFSYETMTDEFMFVIGPVLVGIASTFLWWAPLALTTALIASVVGAFALTTPPSPTLHRQSDTPRPTILSVLAAIWPTIGTMMGVGAMFGAVQAGMTARALEQGAPGQAGLWYALMGIGSAFIALMVVLIPERISPTLRIAAPALGVAGILVLVSSIHSLPLTGTLLIFAGLGIGVTLVTSFATAEALAPPGGLAVAMTAIPAAITIGVSLGSFIGGYSSDLWGSGTPFLVAAAALFGAATCALGLRSLSNAHASTRHAPHGQETR